MGTAQVTFVVVVLLEVIACACTSGSDVTDPVLRVRNRFTRFFSYYSSSTVVPLRMTDRATGNDVTHPQTEFGGVPRHFVGCFGNDVIRMEFPRVRAYGSWGFLPIRVFSPYFF